MEFEILTDLCKAIACSMFAQATPRAAMATEDKVVVDVSYHINAALYVYSVLLDSEWGYVRNALQITVREKAAMDRIKASGFRPRKEDVPAILAMITTGVKDIDVLAKVVYAHIDGSITSSLTVWWREPNDAATMC